jgi:hypothetical protein
MELLLWKLLVGYNEPMFSGSAFDFVPAKPQVDARAEGSSLIIDAETIIFTTPEGTVALLRNATSFASPGINIAHRCKPFLLDFRSRKVLFSP